MKSLFFNIFLVLSISTTSYGKVIERVVAVVNGNAITLTELNDYRKKLKSEGLVDDALLMLTDKKSLLKSNKNLIDHLINEKIIDHEVKKNNLSITIERVEQEVRNITKRNNISRNQLQSALKEKGVAFSDYQNFIKTSLERQSLIEKEIRSKIKISDEDISDYYIKHSNKPDSLVFRYTLSQIFVSPKSKGKVEAKNLAQRISEKLKKGVSFNTLASQYSEDPSFTKGGYWGEFTLNEMSKPFQEGLAKVNAGETSGVISSPAGFHIIKVTKKTLVEDPQLEAQKESIRNIIFANLFKNHFKGWLDRKRQEAFIRINN